jgi:hypothetical protein
MSFVAVAIGGSALIGGAVAMSSANSASKAASNAANTQADAATRAAQIQADAANRGADIQQQESEAALALQKSQFDTTQANYAPWLAAGDSALSQETNLLGLNGAGPQTNAFSQFQADPGYQYTVDQAVHGVDRSAAARGLLTSGATIKAIQDRAANLADQGYSNYFNRISGVAGTGQTATNNVANAGQTAVNNESNDMLAGANARASGYNTAAAAGAAGINTAGTAGANAYINSANAGIAGANGLASSLNNGVSNYFAYKSIGGNAYAPYTGGNVNVTPINSAFAGGV